MKELQKGRSMIEMLGVLAIIGVLSIGGLAGYTMAMNRHRANQILDYVSRCAVAAQTKGDGYKIDAASCKDLLPLETEPNGLVGKVSVLAAAASASDFTITVTGIASNDIATALADRQNTNVTITKTAATGNNATGYNVTFKFKK